MEPAFLLVPLRGCGVREGIGRVISLEDVLDDCARLPEFDAGVWVLDGGDAAVGELGGEGRLLDFGEVHQNACVGDLEFGEDDGDFPWVGTLAKKKC